LLYLLGFYSDFLGCFTPEVVRRKWLEDNPEASSNLEPVLFETSTVPWWAWVKRFHLPEAELLNGWCFVPLP